MFAFGQARKDYWDSLKAAMNSKELPPGVIDKFEEWLRRFGMSAAYAARRSAERLGLNILGNSLRAASGALGVLGAVLNFEAGVDEQRSKDEHSLRDPFVADARTWFRGFIETGFGAGGTLLGLATCSPGAVAALACAAGGGYVGTRAGSAVANQIFDRIDPDYPKEIRRLHDGG